MSALERIVRPALPASIRPAVAQPAAPQSDPTQGIASITGGGGSLITLSHSASSSFSKQKHEAFFKVYDVVRVHNVANDSQYVDQEVITFMRMRDLLGIVHTYTYPHPEGGPADPAAGRGRVEILKVNQVASISSDQLGSYP